MKHCSKCKILQEDSEFSKDKNQKSGLSCACRSCARDCNKIMAAYRIEYRKINYEKLKEKAKVYREGRKDYIKEYLKKYNIAHPNYRKDHNTKYSTTHKEERKEYGKKYRIANREKFSAYLKEYRIINRDKHIEAMKLYGQLNKKKLREKANERRRQKMKTDIHYKLLHNLRRRLGLVIEGKRKADTTRRLIGCDLPTLKDYLQSKFNEGMSWTNYGSYWEVDHIIPCKKFNLLNEEDQKKCFHYTNLQPLTSIENRAKGAKIL